MGPSRQWSLRELLPLQLFPRLIPSKLYSAGAHEPKQLVRISSSQEQDGSPRIVLRIANEALPLGLLEPCILAAALMYSGRRFD